MSSFWVDLLDASVYRLQGRYRTRIIEAGEGKPLVLLHGTGGHAENYIRNIMPLAQRHRVIAMDFIWHGGSQTSGFDPQVLPPLVDQVLDVLDTLKIGRAHLEGQSLGGWVAMLFALAHPQRLGRLVLTTPMGYRPDGHEEPDAKAAREANLSTLRDPSFPNVKTRLQRIVANPAMVEDESVHVRQHFYSDPAVNAVQQKLMTHYLGGPEPKRHAVTDAMARRIAAPTLVYWGDKNFVPAAVGQRLASRIPNGKFICAPNCGHWAQFESFELHNREVLDFLAVREPVL
ncbi:MAG: alpha/beta fold hydrolase [Betaproteobacteria bacterium]